MARQMHHVLLGRLTMLFRAVGAAQSVRLLAPCKQEHQLRDKWMPGGSWLPTLGFKRCNRQGGGVGECWAWTRLVSAPCHLVKAIDVYILRHIPTSLVGSFWGKNHEACEHLRAPSGAALTPGTGRAEEHAPAASMMLCVAAVLTLQLGHTSNIRCVLCSSCPPSNLLPPSTPAAPPLPLFVLPVLSCLPRTPPPTR